ncbi:conserved hypothetical protein [Vibrio chagasii]|nr:conserved hypothetical protein [Vibrio chagasii]
MMNKTIQLGFDIKSLGSEDDMTFTAYGNTKNYADHSKDIVLDGAYKAAIERKDESGQMPKLLWSHDLSEMPIGTITEIKEDGKGLWFKGTLLPTQRGKEVYIAMKMGALDSFSIGYRVIKEDYDRAKGVNYLQEIDVMEISVVNLPDNDQSLLQEIKSRMDGDELPSKRDVQRLLQHHCNFSRRDAEKTMNQFVAKQDTKSIAINDMLKAFNHQ